jgi:hypothetical protein
MIRRGNVAHGSTWKSVVGWSLIALALSWVAGAAPAAADDSSATSSSGGLGLGQGQAFLYELNEDAVLLNNAGHVLVPGNSPTGLVDSTNGAVGVPAIRHAVSQLQGVAMLGSLLCPVPQEVTVGSNECTVIATGTDDVKLVIDPSSGQLVPTSGAVYGTYAVVVQLDNSADSPEMPVQTGTFNGVINFKLPSPLGFVSGGTFTIDGVPGSFPFNATFRQPVASAPRGAVITNRGRTVSGSRGDSGQRYSDAFYLLDDGSFQVLVPEERAVGWPTVRFEISF